MPGCDHSAFVVEKQSEAQLGGSAEDLPIGTCEEAIMVRGYPI